jgi:DNA-binding transcriptional ArsR family regulator
VQRVSTNRYGPGKRARPRVNGDGPGPHCARSGRAPGLVGLDDAECGNHRCGLLDAHVPPPFAPIFRSSLERLTGQDSDPNCFWTQVASLAVAIRFNAYESVTQILWRIVETAASKLDFVSPQLAAAMSHPTRVHAMSILLERIASPRQVADAIDEPLNNVTYHLNQLRELGCIELVRTERVHGGRVLERFYQATQRVYFDEDAWEVLDEKSRLDLVSVALRMVSQDITTAMASGTLFGEDNAHISRSPMVVDDEGWREITELIARATQELFDVEARVAARCADADPPDINAKVEMLQFRSPPFDGEAPPAEG